jgi:hypothetical protein
LWPEETAAGEEGTDAPEVRAGFAAQLRRLIATQLEVATAVVDEAQYETPDGAPTLVVVERFQPGEAESGELIGLADPAGGFGRYGPATFVSGADAAPAVPEPAFRFGEGVEDAGEAAESVAGGGWTAAADAGFTRLEVDGVSWRAAVGEPVWASGDLLVTRNAGVLLIYRFDARPLEEAD